jgi:hypothetical protein
MAANGIITADEASSDFVATFLTAVAAHRFWDRPGRNRIDAHGEGETRGRAAAHAPPA